MFVPGERLRLAIEADRYHVETGVSFDLPSHLYVSRPQEIAVSG